jgi:hypothetical protein
MIFQEERDNNIYDQDSEFEGDLVEPQPGASSWEQFLHMHHTLRGWTTHDPFQADLIEHMWLQRSSLLLDLFLVSYVPPQSTCYCSHVVSSYKYVISLT